MSATSSVPSLLHRWMLLSLLAVAIAGVSGCRGASSQRPSGYQTIPEAPNRNTTLARRDNARAVALLAQGKLPQAEAALKNAVEADVTFGPAHNNLGKVYYQQSKFYLAAWEFKYAIKLLPYHSEPRNNLGLVYESVGRLNEAVAQYDSALELQPDQPQFIGNMARARVRRGDLDEQTRQPPRRTSSQGHAPRLGGLG